MPKPAACPVVLIIGSLVLGCGPGDIASDGGFGGGGSSTAEDPIAQTDTGMSDPPDPSGDTAFEDSGSDGVETETETGANDWTDPETETETGDLPEPIDADCSRVWLHVDAFESHGHLGATPIGSGPAGGFVSVTPVLASVDGVNVDARIRSWSPSGELSWDEQVSWADHRDDPLALVSDELGDVFLAGRINANTFEDAMVSKLDGASGELQWTFLRGAAGGYSSIAHNGAAVVVAGMIDGVGLEVLALETDTGELLWSSDPELVGASTSMRGLVVADGRVDILLGRSNSVDIVRFEPPETGASTLANSIARGPGTAGDLERFGPDRLAALYGFFADSFVAIVDHETGELLETVEIDPFPEASTTFASELVVLPDGGLGVAGNVEINAELQTFVARLDAELNLVCAGLLSEDDVDLAWPPELRGLVVGDDGALYTGSYVVTPRRSVYARWD